jgi:selenium-binding protein 1
MPRMTPDPTFYPSPMDAMEAPPEKLAYVALLDPSRERPDAIGVVDLDPASSEYGRLVGRTDMPGVGDELHHFGWNACSSHLCAWASHPHVERRYLVVPGIHTSRITVLDTKPNPRQPEIVKVIEGNVVAEKTGYTAPHTTHCGPDGLYINALGGVDGKGPGGIFTMDHETFEVKGAWEADRGDQYLAYDFWWHLGHDTMITSEWGTPEMVTKGLDPELLLNGEYGHSIHLWDLKTRKHIKRIDLGKEHQMVLELRPAHDPRRAYGFAGIVISLEDLSSSIWVWYLDGDNGTAEWKAKKVITIPAQPADPDDLPEMLKGFGAVPPLVTDLNLSLDDSTLYVSCWGTGELIQYDVSDPFDPRQTGVVEIGGIVKRRAHPARPGEALNGGPQMVEISRDGRRIYFTNSLYSPWDEQFYPDGIKGWMVKVDADPEGGIALDPDFFVQLEDGIRPHQVRLQGGDASSDSFCFAQAS